MPSRFETAFPLSPSMSRVDSPVLWAPKAHELNSSSIYPYGLHLQSKGCALHSIG